MGGAILVTGGAGYIGSHACKALAKAGYLPVVYDNLSRGHSTSVKWGPLEIGDLADSATIKRVLVKHRIEAVMHFAAFAYVAESVSNPNMYFENNVGNTLKLLRAMLDEGVNKLVFSSTCATYGIPAQNPISEDHPRNPLNPYGESKLMMEQIIERNAQAYGIRPIILRYFNAAGADPEGEIGECHQPETHLIPLAIQAAMGLMSHLSIFGTDYQTPDGTAIRDYVHVSDLADAHVNALKIILSGREGGAFNLGTGKGYSVKEIVHAVEEFGGRVVPHALEPRRKGDPPVLIADPSHANKELNWQPSRSDLNTIVSTAWNWQENMMSTSAGANPDNPDGV